jgi:hypothetical protein
MAQAMATTDHDTIKRWVEARRGHPALVKATERQRGRGGLLRIDFDPPEESLAAIGWDEFFEIFEENELVFLYQDQTASGRKSRFNKFVSRDSVDPDRNEGRTSRGTGRRNGMGGNNGETEPRGLSPGDVMDDVVDEDEDEDALESDDEEGDDDQRRRRN